MEGGLIGLTAALTIFALIQFNLPERLGFLHVTNFFVSVPSYLAVSFNVVGAGMVLVHFGYWILMGILVGWCFGKGWPGKIIVFLFLLLLAYFHFQANQLMAKRFEAAFREAPDSLNW